MRGKRKSSTRSVENYHGDDNKTFCSNDRNREIEVTSSIINENKLKLSEKIGRFRHERKKKQFLVKNLKIVKRTEKICEALHLPKVLNLNPGSIYNKIEEFVTFVQEEKVNLICISESFERETLPLENVIKLDGYKVISNVHQRKGEGGRPAIIVDTKNYVVENITQGAVNVPWGVEAVWAVLMPKNVTNTSKIQKIVVGSIYSKPGSRKKT